MAENYLQTQKEQPNHSRRQVKQIDILPDDVLLEIFIFYLDMTSARGWQLLVHVCRRWRSVVFGSPRHLNLRLFCTSKTPARDTLDVWPALPLIIWDEESSDMYNIIAALEQSNRVCDVTLCNLPDRQLEEVLAAMQAPFPELTDLRLTLFEDALTYTVPVIPDSFLDGSAPRLRAFELDGIPFPGLPKLLPSATCLVYLRLVFIPHSGYISPEAIVASLSVLSSLETLILRFTSSDSRPDQETRHPPPSKRYVIPALTSLEFKGVTEYLEDLVTGIDTPQLCRMDITLDFIHEINFDITRLTQFINRTLKFTKRDVHIYFGDLYANIVLQPEFSIAISWEEPDWQLLFIERVYNSLHPLSTVEDLYIYHQYRRLEWENDAFENALWLELLLLFTAVKNLYLSKALAPDIAAALQELVGGRITEVLPRLQNIFVEGLEPSGLSQENIEQFVAARQLSDHPIAISAWDTDFT